MRINNANNDKFEMRMYANIMIFRSLYSYKFAC